MAADRLSDCLDENRFALLVEVEPSDAASLASFVDERREIAALALTDRPGGPDSAQVAVQTLRGARTQPLVQVAGHGRTAADLHALAGRLAAGGLRHCLITTGDGGATGPWQDAVAMLPVFGAAGLRLGVVVDPARPAEMSRLDRKRQAGARFAIAQIGFSWRGYRDLRAHAPPELPLLAAVAYLPPGIAAALADGRVPGVSLPGALLARIQAHPGRAAAARRLALQILALRRLGYGGAHIAGIRRPQTLAAVLSELAAPHEELEDPARWWCTEISGGKASQVAQ